MAGGLSFSREVCPGGVVAGRVAVVLGDDAVCVRMLGEGGIDKELHLVSNADVARQPKAVAVKVERRRRDERGHLLFHVARAARTCSHSRMKGGSVCQTLRAHGINLARAITHCTSQKAELFSEIRMMRQSAVWIAGSAMNAYDCCLFL